MLFFKNAEIITMLRHRHITAVDVTVVIAFEAFTLRKLLIVYKSIGIITQMEQKWDWRHCTLCLQIVFFFRKVGSMNLCDFFRMCESLDETKTNNKILMTIIFLTNCWSVKILLRVSCNFSDSKIIFIDEKFQIVRMMYEYTCHWLKFINWTYEKQICKTFF